MFEEWNRRTSDCPSLVAAAAKSGRCGQDICFVCRASGGLADCSRVGRTFLRRQICTREVLPREFVRAVFPRWSFGLDPFNHYLQAQQLDSGELSSSEPGTSRRTCRGSANTSCLHDVIKFNHSRFSRCVWVEKYNNLFVHLRLILQHLHSAIAFTVSRRRTPLDQLVLRTRRQRHGRMPSAQRRWRPRTHAGPYHGLAPC